MSTESRSAEITAVVELFQSDIMIHYVLASVLAFSGTRMPERYQKWLDEEVVYIISDQERAEFKGLSTDTGRDAFIDRFWKIRDTDSSTEESEFKKEHYERIRCANERFHDGIPGWKTDRGRIWIIHGPPDDRHYEYGAGSLADSMKLAGGGDRETQGERYLYQTRLAARPGSYKLAVYATLRKHQASA